MLNRSLGRTGFQCSIIGMGCAHIDQDYAGKPALSEKRGKELVDYALSVGINLFDVSDSYGQSVRRHALERDALVCCNTDQFREKEEKTELLFVHHYGRRRSRLFGKVEYETGARHDRRWARLWDGASVYREWKKAISWGFESIQMPFNLLDHEIVPSDWPDTGIIARSVLLQGKLEPLAEEAIRFTAFSGVTCTLLGFYHESEIDKALRAIEKGPIEWEAIVDPRNWRKDVLEPV